MNEEDLIKFQKHIGESTEHEIDGDKFNFVPLSCEYFGKLQWLSQCVTEISKDNKNYISKDGIIGTTDLGFELIKVMVKLSYPDLDDTTMDKFIMGNYFTLLNILFDEQFQKQGVKDR